MVTILENVHVYTPENKGIKSVLIVGDRFEGLYDELDFNSNIIKVNRVNCEGKFMFPGFIDNHVHILGGGGEGGFTTRTPEIKFTDLTKAGITTVVGCIGTDDVCRDMKTLIAKVKELEGNGISAYCYTGSYSIPVKTITNSIKEDLMLLNDVIGVGEIALSDHRSSQPTYDSFVNLVSQARVGGLLSGKSGIVNVHIGGGARRMDMLFSLIRNTEIPPTQLLPTHVNRTEELFKMGVEYIKEGGYIDFTTSSDEEFLEKGELTASEGLKKILDMNLPISHVTFSSDGNGSMPNFNEKRELIGLKLCNVSSLYEEVKKAILNKGISIELALSTITSNVAKILKLKDKGEIKSGNIADFVLVNKESLEIEDVYAKGEQVVKDGTPIKKGIFE